MERTADTSANGAGTARLLVQCPDRPGIVAAVSAFLFEHNANIVAADQYSAGGGRERFFMRMEYELQGLTAAPDALAQRFGESVAPRFAMEWRQSLSTTRPRVAMLVSRYDHCLLDLLWRWRRDELAVQIPMVISNHDTLRADVESFGVSFHFLPVTAADKAAQEAQILARLDNSADVLVMARYMQILSPEFLRAFRRPVINIHHSFLPAFMGADPYGQAFDRGVKIIGATAHYASDDLDEGPIIEQDVERVSHRDARADLIRLGKEVERAVLARAVRWHIEDRVFVDGNRTVVFR